MGVKGPNLTITQRQASPLLALAEGVAMVTRGRTPVGLVGAVDELNPLLHSVLDRFGALARPDHDGCEVARPFDAQRRGFLAGDGAAFLVLENEVAARRRGATILCRVVSCGRGFDPDAPRAGWGRDPSGLSETVSRHLHAAGIRAEQIDLIVASGCGSPAADRIEALAMRSVFNDRPLPPLLAPKAVTGDHGGGFLAASVLAACSSPFGATPGFEKPDPELGVVPHRGGELPSPRLTLVTSFAAGGAAAWAVLERSEE
jgi:3-oxoacyl-(acyl-carrier-protein) synthase